MSKSKKNGAKATKKEEIVKTNESEETPEVTTEERLNESEENETKDLARQMFAEPTKPHFTKKQGEIERKYLTMLYNVDSLLHAVSSPDFDVDDDKRGSYIKNLLDAKQVVKDELEAKANKEHERIESEMNDERKQKNIAKNVEKADDDTIMAELAKRGININDLMKKEESSEE